jgi:hypothetical protein
VLNAILQKFSWKLMTTIKSYKDPIALDSLFEQAMACETLSDFEQDLAHR